MFAFYILAIITLPLFGVLALCELAFWPVYRHVPAFRRWFDGMCAVADSWE